MANRAKQLGFADRDKARTAAAAIRDAISDPAKAGERGVIHIDLSLPRRGLWLTTWANLPGLMLDRSTRTYTHVLLPGWQYTVSELLGEMIADLEHFAKTGQQPKAASR